MYQAEITTDGQAARRVPLGEDRDEALRELAKLLVTVEQPDGRLYRHPSESNQWIVVTTSGQLTSIALVEPTS